MIQQEILVIAQQPVGQKLDILNQNGQQTEMEVVLLGL
jgi:hypothetical protein